MPYAPNITYRGDQFLFEGQKRASEQFNNFLAGFLMPNTPTGDVPNPNAPDYAAFDAGAGPVRDPNATMKRPGPSLLDRFTAGAKSSLEGFDRYKQDSEESNALEKLLKTMYPDRKAEIDTMSLGEKRGMLQADQVQKATSQAQQQQQMRMLQVQTALARAVAAQKAAEERAGRQPLTVNEGRTSFGVPYATYGNVIHFSDELAPDNPKYNKPEKPRRDPGEGPVLSKDGKFYWDDAVETWKPLPSKNSGLELFPGAGGASTVPTTNRFTIESVE